MSNEISYLRMSITDRCNLKCIYCSTPEERKYLPQSELLSYEEILLIQQAVSETGIRKIRLTGGEPLVRRNIVYLIQEMCKNNPEIELAITTNGQLLPELGKDIFASKIRGINISIDSLVPSKYWHITHGGDIRKVLKGIQMAIDSNIARIKLNIVLIRGINDDEIIPFAIMAKEFPVTVRFIEYMPVGKNNWKLNQVVSGHEVRQVISKQMEIYPVFNKTKKTDGPEVPYIIKGGAGNLGFINPVSHQFCHSCNRLRITCNGNLKPCLLSDQEIDLKDILRTKPFSITHLVNTIKFHIEHKQKYPPSSSISSAKKSKHAKRSHKEMWAIGG